MISRFISLILLFLAVPAHAALEIIELRHRSAEEMLPIIRPLLVEGETASGMNYQLILRASPGSVRQIKELLENLDVAPRRLRITVMQNVDRETAARLVEASGSARLGRNARVIVPGGGSNDGLNVELGQGQDKLKARVASTRSQEVERNTQQLQVLEGNRALVRRSQALPVAQRQVIQDRWGTRVIESTQYQEAGSGFYVLPRISGDRVTLEISTQNDAFVPGSGEQPAIRVQQSSTTVSGWLGEWLEVGGAAQWKNSDDSTISTRSASSAGEQGSVLIRVEMLE